MRAVYFFPSCILNRPISRQERKGGRRRRGKEGKGGVSDREWEKERREGEGEGEEEREKRKIGKEGEGEGKKLKEGRKGRER